MKLIYILLFALTLGAVSCKTKDGEPGPAGSSGLIKQGTISGTISYTDDNGNPATTAFDYQYFETLEDNRFYFEENGSETYHQFDFSRRDMKDINNTFSIYGYGYGDGLTGVEEDPYISSLYLNFLTIINNELYEFEGNGITVTNYNLDPTTGRVTFDFSGSVYESGNSGTVSGRVDVALTRVSYSFGD